MLFVLSLQYFPIASLPYDILPITFMLPKVLKPLVSQPLNHPFRLLLYLEWLLLGFASLSQILPVPFDVALRLPGLPLLWIFIFGLMGLRLPTERSRHQALYIGAEFGLIWLTIVTGGAFVTLPILIAIIMIRSCQMFQRSGRLGVAILTFVGLLLVTAQQSQMQDPMLEAFKNMQTKALPSDAEILPLKFTVAFSFGLLIFALLLLVNSLLAEHDSRTQLTIVNDKLRQYAQSAQDQATLQERNRIAREIHDTLGHALTAQSIQLENALMFCPTDAEKTQAFLIEAKQLCSQALHDVRQSVATLRSNPLLGRPLQEAIALAIQEFHQTTGITPTHTLHLSSPLSADISTTLYRIIQEALMNIYKHSSATQVAIHLQESEKEITLWIEDNGCGFHPDQNTTGFGIQVMHERILAMNGEFHLVSQPGAGCLITAQVPLDRRSRRTL
ncbi:MAG: sensor histidine kinase [Drouetiella hepatica Uher 2000/2452]|uniref:Oxygen sensor histidine kinase NreB n=1 Tax=Drouetiella hepatica Uher 2000/2452 TaxID=904376 RepID=A0A951QEE9_9CYAN|nr:sensor histidine kinase [Drouetiella hepatica Uher 2000/2452]